MPRRPSSTPLVLLLAALVAAPAGPASAGDTFGPSNGLQLWPELDVIHGIDESFRVIGKLEPVFTPSAGNHVMGLSLYGSWMVAPFTDVLVSPDLAKRRRLDVRVGVSWYPTTAAGDVGWSDQLRLEAEATMRTNVPGAILATLRGRVEAQWELDAPTSFEWRFRIRPQLEREFVLSREAGTSLTPFANVELIWTTAQDMWSQFRIQAGLQLGVNWFWKGQVIELNGQVITYLQPSRSHAPTIGLVWYQYL
ncbi:MAG TPA: hypothetical protein VFM53_12830 [Anaeromyxobacteraceae bacterium]|nr:hypothetical protein [Anaeromyxobacteraceae bacterium]